MDETNGWQCWMPEVEKKIETIIQNLRENFEKTITELKAAQRIATMEVEEAAIQNKRLAEEIQELRDQLKQRTPSSNAHNPIDIEHNNKGNGDNAILETKKALVIGDSNMRRIKNELLVEIAGDQAVDIRYYGGKKIKFLIDKAKEWLDNTPRAQTIVLAGGLNDLLHVNPKRQIEERQKGHIDVLNEMKRMIDVCKSRAVQLIVCTVPAVTRYNIKANVEELNLALKKTVTEEKNSFIEILETDVAAQFLEDDEMHFGLAGVAIMAKPWQLV